MSNNDSAVIIKNKDDSTGGPSSLKKPHLVLYTLFLLVMSLAVSGFGIYRNNHCIEIPLIKLFNNPHLYPNDPYAAILPQFGSMLWRVVALGARFVPLLPLLIGLLVAERLLLIYAAGRAANALVPKSKLAVLSPMALFALVPESILAQGTIATFYFEQTGLAIAFVLLAIASFYRHKAVSWAILMAVVFNLQSMYGAYALTYFGAAFLFDGAYRKQWKTWIGALALFAILSTPNVLLTLSDFKGKAVDNHLWVTAAFIRFAPHLRPLTWGKAPFTQYGVLILALLLVLRVNRHSLSSIYKHAWIWACVGVAWLIYAFAAAQMRNPYMLVMQPGRATDICCCFAAIALPAACASQLEKSSQHKYILLAGLLASILFWHVKFVSAIAVAGSLLASRNRPSTEVSSTRIRLPAVAVLLAVLFTAVALLGTRINHEGGIKKAMLLGNEPEVIEVAKWANTHTPPDAVFLTDLSWTNFRAISERPVFTTWKDGSGILWDRPFVSEWAARLRILGLDLNDPRLTNRNVGNKLTIVYRQLNDSRVEQIATRYPIRYWVVPLNHKSTFPVVLQTKASKVLLVSHTAPVN